MGIALRTCSSCGHALADGVLFCPSCGAATPTEISRDTGVARAEATTELSVDEQRRRVQSALGESFQVLHLLGQGGFAEVWAAADLKLKRQVAVKVLRGDLVISAALSERFRREAEAVAKLRHPNIVPIYQVGEGAGLSYYVMPLIEGESLRHRLERGPLPIAEARRILEEVAGALSVAHKAGIVHRDVKPDNIMLEGEEARPVVMDFGIAKALTEGESGLTGTGMIVGTPHYMSPEQASGEKTVDSRSDIYSLGVVAYQMVAGHLPFEGDSSQEVLVKHITAKPKPLDAVRPDTPVELSDAVMKCLRKSPAERWNTAGELAAAVRPRASLVKVRSPAWRWLRRPGAALRQRQARLELYAILLLVLVGAIVLMDPTALRWAWAYWAGTAQKPFVPQSFEVGWQGAAKSALTLGPDETSLWSVGDSLLLVKPPLGGPYAYDGRAWRLLEYPVERALFPPLAWRGGLWAIGLRNVSSVLIGSSSGAISLRDSLPYQVTATWSDGRSMLLGTADGRILRSSSGGWQREPTGASRTVIKLLGTASRQVALLAGSPPPDSILQFNGLNWQSVQIRPDSARSSVITSGATLADGELALVGALCDRGRACNVPLVLISDSTSARWNRAAVRFPLALRLTGVFGSSVAAYYVYGGGDGGECPAGATCFFHVVGDSARPVEALRGATIIGVASLRGVPFALTSTGALWTQRGGSWGVVGEVPGSIIRGVAAARSVGLLGWNPQLMTLGIQVASFWRATAGTVSSRRSRTEIRTVAVTSDSGGARETLWMLSVSGALSRIECVNPAERFARWRCTDEQAVPGPDRRKVLTLDAGSDDSLRLGGERGLVAVRTAVGWYTQQLPAAIAAEDVVSISVRGGGPRLLLTTTHLCRADAAAAWGKCDVLPPALAPVAVKGLWPVADSTRAAAGAVAGAGGVFMARDSGRLTYPMQLAPGGASATALETLADGRVVVGYATPEDPLLGGHLFVGGVGATEFDSTTIFGSGGTALICTFQWREVPLPPGMDVYGIKSTTQGVIVVGNGWRWIEFGHSQLPFARRPQCSPTRRGS